MKDRRDRVRKIWPKMAVSRAEYMGEKININKYYVGH
jgi:hypothetical protein